MEVSLNVINGLMQKSVQSTNPFLALALLSGLYFLYLSETPA